MAGPKENNPQSKYRSRKLAGPDTGSYSNPKGKTDRQPVRNRGHMTDKEIDQHYYHTGKEKRSFSMNPDLNSHFTIQPMPTELYKPKNKGQK